MNSIQSLPSAVARVAASLVLCGVLCLAAACSRPERSGTGAITRAPSHQEKAALERLDALAAKETLTRDDVTEAHRLSRDTDVLNALTSQDKNDPSARIWNAAESIKTRYEKSIRNGFAQQDLALISDLGDHRDLREAKLPELPITTKDEIAKAIEIRRAIWKNALHHVDGYSLRAGADHTVELVQTAKLQLGQNSIEVVDVLLKLSPDDAVKLTDSMTP